MSSYLLLVDLVRKKIRSEADLAIFGASPAFDTPIHVGRPRSGNHSDFVKHVSQILNSRWLTNNGPMVQELESRISTLLGVKHCLAMCNGTIALEIAIRALGLNGEVIIPSWTFIATAHSLYWQGIRPVFADIDPITHNLDPESVRNMITPRTTGIIGVHLWGRPSPIDELQTIADSHGLQLMFDAAHAFGCSYKGKNIGNFGRCEVMSFHATKVFNTFEGGAVLTNDDELAEKIRLMRNFGFQGYDKVVYPGTNGKLSEVNAAMGLVNLEALPQFIELNRQSYYAYSEALKSIDGVNLVGYDKASNPNYHYIVLELDDTFPATRDTVVDILQAENILARKYFWPGCHRMSPYSELFPHADTLLINTEKLAKRIIVLPNEPEQSDVATTVLRDIFEVLTKRKNHDHL